MTTVQLTNYLWIPKTALAVPPPVFAPGWEYRIELLKTSEGRIKQQQIAVLRQQAEASGLDPDEFIKEISANDHLLIKNWSEVGDWWALCAGDISKVEALCRQHKWTIKDKRAEVPWPDDLSQKLKMVMKPRENQVGPFKTWVKAGHGIFKAAPAFGKTLIMVWYVTDFKQRTLFLTHTDQLAEQFIQRFRHGSPRADGKSGFIPVTNCLEVEEELGREIIGRYRGPDTLWPVTVATWQSFISPGGRKAMKALKEEFGLILCDESLPGEAKILTEDGYRTIESIVQSQKSIRVVAFDGDNFALRRVTRTWAHRPKSPMMEVVHTRGAFRATANHPILTTVGWVSVGELQSSHDLVCYSHDRPEVSVDGWIGDGGCLDQPSPGQEASSSQVEGISFDRATSFGGCQVHGVAGLVPHSSEGGSKRGLGGDGLPLLHVWPGRDRGSAAEDVSRPEKGRGPTSFEGPLGSSHDGVVDHGRRESVRGVFTPSYRELYAGGGGELGALDDSPYRMGCQSSASKKEQTVFHPYVQSLGVGRPSNLGSPSHHSGDGVQDHAGVRSSSGVSLLPVWGKHPILTREERQVWLDEVLSCARVPQGGLSDRSSFVQGTERGEHLQENDGEKLRPLRAANRPHRPIESEVLSGSGVSETQDANIHGNVPSIASRVLFVREVGTPEIVYDLSVEKDHNFIVDGVVAHNCHVFAAPAAASVVNGFAAKQKRGVTATPKRKDQLDVALYDVMGQVTAVGKSDQLPVAAYMISTGVAYKGRAFPGMGQWAAILNFLYKHADRNDLITKWIVHDASQGRKILILGERRTWILEMAETLKKEYGIEAKAVVGGVEGSRRDAIIQEMTSGTLQVLLCTTKIGREGLDIPPLDTLYATMPLANKSGLEQMLGRERRPYPTKKPPVLFRYFVDEGAGPLYGCARATHRHLVDEGAEIFLVEAGKEPAKVMLGAKVEEPLDDGVLEPMPKRKGSLKAAAARAPSAVRKLFTDLKEETRLSKQYTERRGKNP